MVRSVLGFLRDQRGTVTIEMAAVAPILATLLIGMSEMARAYSAKMDLEQGVQRGIEYVQQGKAATLVTNAIKNEVAAGAGISVNAVTVTTSLDCIGGLTNQPFSASCSGSQSAARYVRINASKTYSTWFGTRINWSNKNADGTITLNSQSAVRIQ